MFLIFGVPLQNWVGHFIFKFLMLFEARSKPRGEKNPDTQGGAFGCFFLIRS